MSKTIASVEGRKVSQKDLEEMGAVFVEAVRWWCAKRPVGYTELDHAYQWQVNCVGQQERNLAKAVAKAKFSSLGMDWPTDEEFSEKRKKMETTKRRKI